MPNQKLTNVYNLLKQNGDTNAKDVNEFAKRMAGTNYRQQVYGFLKKNGVGGLGGGYDEFSRLTGYGKKAAKPKSAPAASTVQATAVGEKAFGGGASVAPSAPAQNGGGLGSNLQVAAAPQVDIPSVAPKSVQGGSREAMPHGTGQGSGMTGDGSGALLMRPKEEKKKAITTPTAVEAMKQRDREFMKNDVTRPIRETRVPEKIAPTELERSSRAAKMIQDTLGKDIQKRVDDAIAKGDAEYYKTLGEESAKNGMSLGFSMDDMAEDISNLASASRKANAKRDPAKMTEDIQKALQENLGGYLEKNKAQIVKNARDAEMSVEDYVNTYIAPGIMRNVSESMRKSQIAKNMPKSDLEYVMKGVESWVPNMLFRAATETPSQFAYRTEADAEYGEKAGLATSFGRGAMEFMDPTFAASMGAGSAVGKGVVAGARRAAMKAATTGAGQAVVKKVGTEAMKRSVNYAVRFGTAAERRTAQALAANKGFVARTLSAMPGEIIGQGLGMNIYGAAQGGAQTLGSTGDIVETGKAVIDGLTSKEGFVSGAAFAMTMPWLHGAARFAGYNKGAGTLGKVGGVLGQGYIDAVSIPATGMVMWLSNNANKALNGEECDWSGHAFMHETAVAAAMKINPLMMAAFKKNPMTGRNMLVEKFLNYGKHENLADPRAFSYWEKEELLDATRAKDLGEVLYKIFPDTMESEGSASRNKTDSASKNVTEAEVAEAQKNFLNVMNNLSWDTQNKLAMALTNTMTMARPRSATFEVEGDVLKELDAEGNVLSRKRFKSVDERDAYITEKKMLQTNIDQMDVYGTALQKNREAVRQIVDEVAAAHGVGTNGVMRALNDAPLRRISYQTEIVNDLIGRLRDIAYPTGEVHVEAARAAGEAVASGADVTGDAPVVDAVTELDGKVDGATESLTEALKDAEWKDYYEDFVRSGMTDAEAYDRLSELGYTEEELAPLAEAINAKAEQEGFMNGMMNDIDTKVNMRVEPIENGVKVINGQATFDAVHLTDAEGNDFVLVHGYLDAMEDGTLKADQPIVVMDAEGNTHAVDAKTLTLGVTEPLEAYADRYRQKLSEKATDVVDPEGKLGGDAESEPLNTEGETGTDAPGAPARDGEAVPAEGAEGMPSGEPEGTGAAGEAGHTEEPMKPVEPTEPMKPVEPIEPVGEPAGTEAEGVPPMPERREIPVREDGEMDYTADGVKAADAVNHIYREMGVDEKTADEYVDEQVENATKAREKAEKDAAKAEEITRKKGEGLNAFANRKKEAVEAAKDALDKAKTEEDRWKAIKEQADMFRTPDSAAEPLNTGAGTYAELGAGEVPDTVNDTPEAARERGYKMVNGVRYDRQEKVEGIDGRDAKVVFGKGDANVKEGRMRLVELDDVQESHKWQSANPMHFIPEAQPKDRTSEASRIAAHTNASKERFDPKLCTGDGTVYTDSNPVVNEHGEVIQGNGRVMMMREVYGDAEVAERYKQYLREHAEEFGLRAEDIDRMKKPVLVTELKVDDAEAIRLGQMTNADLESGGTERIKPENTIKKMGEDFNSFMNILMGGGEDDMSLSQLIDANGQKVLEWMNKKGFVTNTQYESAVKDGKLTAEAKNDLNNMLKQRLFEGAPISLRAQFDGMPAKAQKAILANYLRDMNVPKEAHIMGDIRHAIQAFSDLMKNADFAKATKYEDAKRAIENWKKELNAFESVQNSEKFSTFALELAARLKTSTMSGMNKIFDEYYSLVGDRSKSKNEELGMFGDDALSEPVSKAEAIKKLFNIDINEHDQRVQRGDDVAGNGQSGRAGKRGGTGDASGRERNQSGEPGADGTGGTGGDGEERTGHVEGDNAEAELPHTGAVPSANAEGAEPILAQSALDDWSKPFEERVKGVEPLTRDEVASVGNKYERDQLNSAIRKLEEGKPLSVIEQGLYVEQLKKRNNAGDTTQVRAGDSADADRAQLGEGLDAPIGGGSRGEGGTDEQMDRSGSGEAAAGTVRSGEDSAEHVHPSAGERGDNGVRGEASGVVELPAGREHDVRSSGTGGDGHTVRTRGGEETRKAPSGNDSRAEVESSLKADQDRVKAILERLNAGKSQRSGSAGTGRNNGTLRMDITGGIATWVAKQAGNVDWKALAELGSAVSDVGIDYIRLGKYKFQDWAKNIREDFHDMLVDTFDWKDAEVEDYINEMWNSNYSMDGEEHTLREWASILGDKELRKQIHRSISEKRQAQKDAEAIEVKVGDEDNIRETLPYLLPAQQDDVIKTERQFFDESHQDREHGFGKGMMFTNGTGTGKTYTGLGIVKRFVKQGKGRVLIVTPSQTKVGDWVKDGKNLDLDIKALENTKDAGEGVVITTFANLRANEALMKGNFDLIVYDESHKIMENKQGEETIGAQVHYMLTNKTVRHATDRMMLGHPLVKERDMLREVEGNMPNISDICQYSHQMMRLGDNAAKLNAMASLEYGGVKIDKSDLHSNAQKALERFKKLKAEDYSGTVDEELFNELNRAYLRKIDERLFEVLKETEAEIQRLKPEAEAAVKQTKTVFLSATPFNTRESLKYAEGYIFSYPEEDAATKGSYNHRSPQDAFMEQHFSAGYRWRYGRLEQHVENADALNNQEIAFSDHLQNTLGTLSTRQIENGYDYSRTFPTVTFEKADRFNEVLQAVRRDERFKHLAKPMYDVFFDYNKSTALFEAMKSSLVAERIKEHINRGRKVVVFHRRRTTKDDLTTPFRQALDHATILANMMKKDDPQRKEILEQVTLFEKEYADMLEWEQGLDYRLPREQLAESLGEENVAFFSGAESKKNKDKAIEDFLKDNEGKDVIVIQEASGKEGISLHDTTGVHERVEMSLCLPQSPIAFIQIEGRIYRIGQKSNALFEYPLLGLDLEMNLFANQFNKRVGTTENLAMGSKGRNMAAAISRGVMENSGIIGYDGGVGGREFDGNNEEAQATGMDRAIQDYFTNQKLKGKRDQREGKDYFPTPEPIGYKMVEWAGLGEGETVLEPSAGHGAIARYVPNTNRMVMIEPSDSLRGKLQLNTPGTAREYKDTMFEDYNAINKHDVVLMNPPYGSGGATAVKHVEKAFGHLTEGGRVIAIIPDGPACEKKVNAWLGREKTAVVTAEIRLPQCTFDRAGTGVMTRVVVIDKVTREETRAKAPDMKQIDLRGVSNTTDLFERLRDVTVPERTIDKEFLNDKRAKAGLKGLQEHLGTALNFAHVFPDGDVRVDFRNRFTNSVVFNIHEIANGYALKEYKRLKEKRDGIKDNDWRFDKTFGSGRGSKRVEWTEVEAMRDIYDTLMKTVAKIAGTTTDALDRQLSPEAVPQGTGPVADARWEYKTVKHSKTGEDLHIVGSKAHMTDEEYKAQSARAKALGGFWDRYSKGFRFESKEKADEFMRGDVAGRELQMSGEEFSNDTEAKQVVTEFLTETLGGTDGLELVHETQEEGQKVAQGEGVEMMGSTVNRRQSAIGKAFDGVSLDPEDKTIISVFSGKSNNQTISIRCNDGETRSFLFRQGNERNAGVKHSVYRHNSTRDNYYTHEEILNISKALKNGARDVDDKGRVSYTLEENGVKYTVTTEKKGGKETFTNFFTNRKPTDSDSASYTANQHTQTNQSVSGAKVQQNSDSGNNKGEKLTTPNGTVYGWAEGNKIHLTPEGLNPNTPIHEYTHLWAKAIQKKAPELWKNVKSLLKDNPLVKEILGEKGYEGLSEDGLYSEVLARVSGKNNAGKLEEAAQRLLDAGHSKSKVKQMLSDFKEAVKTAWSWIGKELFGIEKFDSVEEVTDRVLYDLVNKTELGLDGGDRMEPEFHLLKKDNPEDAKLIEELDKQPKRKAYHSMQLLEVGGKKYLFPPMAAVQDGKFVDGIPVNEDGSITPTWEMADENPHLAYRKTTNGKKIPNDAELTRGEDGGLYYNGMKVSMNKETGEAGWYFDLKKGSKGDRGKKLTDTNAVLYDPYQHSTTSPLNDQFTSAYDRSHLVTVEVEIPESEITNPYKAEKAGLATGEHDWKGGIVAGGIKGADARKVILSRYDKPLRIVPDSEVAQQIKGVFDRNGIKEMPFNVVTPSLRDELHKIGVKIGEPSKGNAGDASRPAYEAWKNGDVRMRVDGEAAKGMEAMPPRTRHDVDGVAKKMGVGVNWHEAGDDAMPDKIKAALGRGEDVKGWYDTKDGTVHLYAPNVRSRYDAMQTLWHESVGHKGLRKVMGDKAYNTFLQKMFMDKGNPLAKEMRRFVTENASRNGWKIGEALDEWFAAKAETFAPGRGESFAPGANAQNFWGRVTEMFGDAVRALGYTFRPNVNDVRYLLWVSKRGLGKSEYNPMWRMQKAAFMRELRRAEYLPEIKDGEYVDAAELGGIRTSSDNPFVEGINTNRQKRLIKQYEGQSSKDLFVSLQKKEGKEYYDTVTELARRAVLSGDVSSEGETRRVSSGEVSNGSTFDRGFETVSHVAASIIANDCEGRMEQILQEELSKWREREFGEASLGNDKLPLWAEQIPERAVAERILGWAKRNGCYIGKKYDTEYPITNRISDPKKNIEAEVRRSVDGKTVIKYIVSNALDESKWTIGRKLKELAAENALFGEDAPREVVGFIGGNWANNVCIVVKQPFVEGKTVLEHFGGDDTKANEYIDKYMTKELGFERGTEWNDFWEIEYPIYKKDGYVVKDVNVGNLIIGKDGKNTIIDCIAEREGGDDGIRFRIGSGSSATPPSGGTPTPTKAAVRNALDKKVRGFWHEWKEAHNDNMKSVKDMMEAVIGGKIADIKDAENAYDQQNHATSIAQAEWDKYVTQKYSKVTDAVNACVGVLGGKASKAMDEVEGYLYRKHGLERNRVFFVRDNINKVDAADRDRVEKDWKQLRADISTELKKGAIDYREYLKRMDDFITNEIDGDYDPNKNDYSGINRFDENAVRTDDKLESFNESEIIDKVMETEAKLEGKRVDALWKAIKGATDFSVDYSYSHGSVDKASRDEIKGMFDFYVPLRGFGEGAMEDVYEYVGGHGETNNKKVIMKAEGRESAADSPLAYISAMAETAINQGEQNIVKQKFYRFNVLHPNDKVIISEIWEEQQKDGTWKTVVPDVDNLTRPEAVAVMVNKFNERMEAAEKAGTARKVIGRVKHDLPFKNRVNRSQHMIEVDINGRKKLMYVAGDPRLAQALNGQLENKDNSTIRKNVLRAQASFATSMSPEFILSNLSRDTFFTNANVAAKENAAYWVKYSENQALSLRLLMTGVGGDKLNGESLFEKYYNGRKPSTPVEKMFFEFMDNGGRTGFVAQKAIEQHKTDLRNEIKSVGTPAAAGRIAKKALTLGHMRDAVEEMNMRAELVNRFAVYRTSRQMGRSIMRSVTDSKEVSVNFNRHGAGNAGRGLAGWTAGKMRNNVMFYNASMQALNLLGKNLTKDKQTALKTVMFMGAIPAMIGAAFASILGDNDDYNKIPHWDRRNNLCIPYGDGDYLKFPLPIELRAFWGMGDVIASISNKKLQTENEVWEDMLGQLTQVLPIDVVNGGGNSLTELSGWIQLLPTYLQPMAQYVANKDWTGKPIHKENKFNPDAPMWTLATNKTNSLIVEVCKRSHDMLREGKETDQATDPTGGGNSFMLDPTLYDHLLRSYFGGIYSMSLGIENTVEKLFKEGKFDGAHAPFVRRLYGKVDNEALDQTTNAKFWAYKREADAVKKEYNNPLNKANPNAKNELNNSGRGKRYNLFDPVNKAINELYERAQNISDPNEKMRLNAEVNRMRKELVDALDAIE